MVARFSVILLAIGTVDGFGKNACQSSFAGAARTGEEIGLTNSTEFKGIGKGLDDMLLSDDVSESAWSVFAVQSSGHSGKIYNLQ